MVRERDTGNKETCWKITEVAQQVTRRGQRQKQRWVWVQETAKAAHRCGMKEVSGEKAKAQISDLHNWRDNWASIHRDKKNRRSFFKENNSL